MHVNLECGVTYAKSNVKIVGGIEAVQHSWPSAVIIKTSYKALVDVGGDRILATVGFSCGGI